MALIEGLLALLVLCIVAKVIRKLRGAASYRLSIRTAIITSKTQAAGGRDTM
jgi:hypothetical protein